MEKNSNRIKADELLVRSQDLTTLLGFYKSVVLYGNTMTFQQWKSLLDRQGWEKIDDEQKRVWWKDNIQRLDALDLIKEIKEDEITIIDPYKKT